MNGLNGFTGASVQFRPWWTPKYYLKKFDVLAIILCVIFSRKYFILYHFSPTSDSEIAEDGLDFMFLVLIWKMVCHLRCYRIVCSQSYQIWVCVRPILTMHWPQNKQKNIWKTFCFLVIYGPHLHYFGRFMAPKLPGYCMSLCLLFDCFILLLGGKLNCKASILAEIEIESSGFKTVFIMIGKECPTRWIIYRSKCFLRQFSEVFIGIGLD